MIATLMTIALLSTAHAENYDAWKNRPAEAFSDAEASFRQALELVLKNHVDEKVSREELYRAATAGMLASLNPEGKDWNKLMAPAEIAEMRTETSGQLFGIGIEMRFDATTGHAHVQRVIPGGAAEKTGVQQGDEILSVNGRTYKGLQMRDLVYDIRGKAGEKVKLKLLRGDDVLAKNVTRGPIEWTPVEGFKIGDTGYIRVRYFAEKTPAILERTLRELQAHSWVIDLRGNSGGLLDKAVESAGYFLPKGSVFGTFVKRGGGREDLKSPKDSIADGPVALLVDETTSSGAEMFTASLVANRGAVVVGEKTLGKWNAQMVEKLTNSFAIKFTVKNFIAPKDKEARAVGISPDLEIKSDTDEIDARAVLLKNAADRPTVDPVLRGALSLLKSRS